ncbi:MAG: DUF1684 domain-containing protein [Bacteroidetes bacterium]|nr:DUF1684 domain-containing protein [Bacteroidota bacterium]
MYRCFVLSFFCFVCFFEAQAQSYQQRIISHREKYKQEFLEDENSPLKKRDLKFLQFFEIDSVYKVVGDFSRIIDTLGFDMHTHSGVIKKYYVYGSVEFVLKNTPCKLFIYQSEKLKNKEGFEDYLFIPFTDPTNNVSSFGGGRYLDFRFSDIIHNQLTIDFNTSYNPYCAYKGGYACPIPPRENDLSISVEAGEMNFGKGL